LKHKNEKTIIGIDGKKYEILLPYFHNVDFLIINNILYIKLYNE